MNKMVAKNNPLNIRNSQFYKWFGQTGENKGFCEFNSEIYCYRAAAYLIMRSYRRRGTITVREIIGTWAPPVENPTNNYVNFVCKWAAMSPTHIPTSVEEVSRLLVAMEIFEQGYPRQNLGTFVKTKSKNVAEWINKFNLKFV